MSISIKNAKRAKPKVEDQLPEEEQSCPIGPPPEPKQLAQALIVTDNLDRNKLNEGRTYQMGFSFCKDIGEGKFETIHPISTCKDYLNDVVFTEATGIPIKSCGITSKKENIFTDKLAYMAIKILPDRNKWNNYGSVELENDRKHLRENYKNIEVFINWVEDQLKVGAKTIIKQSSNDPDMFLAEIPVWWCQSTNLISMWALFIRGGQFYMGMSDKSPEKYMKEFSEKTDKENWHKAREKFEYFVEHGPIIVDPKTISVTPETMFVNVHNNGIIRLILPVKERMGTKNQDIFTFDF